MKSPSILLSFFVAFASSALAQESGVARRRFEIPEAAAKSLFPKILEGELYDPLVYFHAAPNRDEEVPWPEHPRGRWTLHTNGLGLRMDRELSEVKPDVRVLFTGDANAAGTCSNDETIATRMENALRAERGGTCEVINAGNGSYSFYNYVGVLERFADRRPDVYVVLVAWNDFHESLAIRPFFGAEANPVLDDATWQRIEQCEALHPTITSQGLRAVRYFETFPEQAEIALATAVSLLGEIAGRCEARGIKLLVAWLPPLYELRPDETVREFAKVFELLGLERADLDVIDRLADRFLTNMRALRIPAIDLRVPFRESKAQLYWKQDHHIDLEANEIVSRELLKILPKLLPPRR